MGNPPQVSVVVAAYHSDRVIADCLTALRAQTLSHFETIVVNSSPADRTREVVCGGFPEVQLVEHATRLLPHAARNLGVVHATGGLIVFTDADCRPAPDWLARCAAAVDAGHAVVVGSIEPAGGGWYALGVHLCKYSFRLSTLPPGPTTIAGTANACYTREVWNAVGPFDGHVFAGDALLGWKASRHGSPPWFEPKAMVRHVFDHGPGDFWRERVTRGVDFARARATAEQWPTWRLAASVLGAPVLPILPLLRGLRDAWRAGWVGTFAATLPLQWAGHLAWSLGEARAAAGMLGSRHRRGGATLGPR